MWLVYTTTVDELKDLLDKSQIKPLDDYIAMNIVTKKEHSKIKSQIFFPLDIMDIYNVSHYISENSIEYDYEITPDENVKIWRKDSLFKNPRVLFTEAISLSDSSFIYSPDTSNLSKDMIADFNVYMC